MTKFIATIVVGIALSSPSRAVDRTCAETLRAAILESSEKNISKRESARISALTSESLEVGAEVSSRATSLDHVISFGSGPDIFRPLYIFPFAGHIHLVDIGNGWLDGFASLFAELENRLRELGPEAIVERVNDGFLRYRPPPLFTGQMRLGKETAEIPGPWRFRKGKWQYFLQPCIWRVRWQSAKHGRQERMVYLHVGDFSDLPFAKALLKSTKGRLAGMFISGIGLPKLPALQEYLKELLPRGLFLAELEYNNSMGKTSSAPEDTDREKWLKDRMRVIQKIPTSDLQKESNPDMFWPTFYVFEKSNEQH